MYGRILLSVVLPFFLIAAGFGYALEIRQRNQVENRPPESRQAPAPRSSPVVDAVQPRRDRVARATSSRANEPDSQPAVLDPMQADYPTAGGGIGSPVSAATDPAGRQAANDWSEPAFSVKPADLITSDDDVALLLASATDLRLFHGNLRLPVPPARPPATVIAPGADGTNAVPEPMTGLLLAIGAGAILRRPKRRVCD